MKANQSNRTMAKNCVSYLEERGQSAYMYECNNQIQVYIVIDDMDLELSMGEIHHRHYLFTEESEENIIE